MKRIIRSLEDPEIFSVWMFSPSTKMWPNQDGMTRLSAIANWGGEKLKTPTEIKCLIDPDHRFLYG